MSTAIIVGDTRPRSITLRAAIQLVRLLTGTDPDLTIDLATMGAALFAADDPVVADVVERLPEANLTVVASPIVRSSYTGLLKLFLDLLPAGTLTRTTAIPLMIGEHPRQAMGGEVFLSPILTDLGARVSTSGLFLLESEALNHTAMQEWIGRERHRLPTRLELLAV